MRGLKISGIFATCGFLLSLIFGLFSHTSFISVLLKALIFAICFGLLGFVIDFIFNKFLLDESVMTTSEGNQNISNGSEGSSTKGQLVDITIEDEELVPSSSDNHFVVSENHQMLNDSDVVDKSKDQTEQKEKTEETQDNGFVPLKNLETLKNFAGKEAVSPDSVVSNTNENEDNSKNLDTLPDMNNLSLENNNSGYEDAETDTDFVSSANMNKNNGEPTEIKDAALMAKAISSVLSDEES